MHLLPLHPESLPLYIAGDMTPLSGALERPPSNLAEIAPLVADIASAYTSLYTATRAEAPWIGYLAASATGEVIGSCGFTANPENGTVEIAYFTFPDYEGRGWAGQMAAMLVGIAFGQDEVVGVRAHTLQEENASTRILRRLGFVQQGTAVDADAGPVWCWHLERGALR
jgi:ribosomal-protein-alanine N-acetyltransferase